MLRLMNRFASGVAKLATANNLVAEYKKMMHTLKGVLEYMSSYMLFESYWADSNVLASR